MRRENAMPAAPYKMATITRLTGLSAVLLRAWERRHALLRPERTEGGHRLYTEDDLRVLRRVQALLRQGRSIGEIEALGRDALLERTGQRQPERPQPASEGVAADVCSALVDAAVSIDGRAAERALDHAFSVLSPDRALAEVIEPALAEVGERWARQECSVAGEHLVSGLVQGRLLRLLESARPARGPSALCGCFPDEDHALGGIIAAWTLSRRGYDVAWLGAALPFEDLERACEVRRPELVLLSVTRAALLELHAPALLSLVGRHPRVRFVVGGAGAAARPAALGELVATGAARSFDPAADDAARPRRRGRSRR